MSPLLVRSVDNSKVHWIRDQLAESDYKNVATVINPLVYWLSFTDGLISLTDPRLLRNDGFVIKDLKRLSNLGPEVVSRGILTSIA